MKKGFITVPNADNELLDAFLVPTLRDAKPYAIDTPDVKIKLDQNETPFDWPRDLKEEVCNRLKEYAWNRYPSALAPDVTEHLARYAQVPASNILTGPGTNYLISLFLSCLTRQLKGKVIISQPSFPLYESHCRYEGVAYDLWPLTDDFKFDLSLLPDVPPHSIIIFASPNNPTGSLLPADQLGTLLERHRTSIVLADEAYFEFAPTTYTPLLNRYPNLVILRTCSKTLGAAGLRLGYALGAKELLAEVGKLRLPFLLNQFTLAAADVFFGSDELQRRVGEHVELIISERERIIASLRASCGPNTRVFESHANFFLIRFADDQHCLAAYRGLIDAGILVRNISKGARLSGTLRISVGTPSENNQFFNTVSKYLK